MCNWSHWRRKEGAAKTIWKKNRWKTSQLGEIIKFTDLERRANPHKIDLNTHTSIGMSVKLLKMKFDEKNLKKKEPKDFYKLIPHQAKYCNQSLVSLEYWGKFYTGNIAAFHYVAQQLCQEFTDKEHQIKQRWPAGEDINSSLFPFWLGKSPLGNRMIQAHWRQRDFDTK